ncbi:MAG: tail fiber domain-containing protein, partial [Ferruginibacter sp.]|nr:tail fiber domain-containing protein [Ferruginibacter sp.]MBU9936314.1 tail fiber domain-containing protein [Ferruginibacter sp.]
IFYKIAGMNNVNELTFGDNSFPNILTRFYLGGTASTNGLNFQSPAFPNLLYMDGLNGRVGIGTGTPAHRLELSTDDAAKPGTGTWTVVSDIRMKQNIRPYTEGLSKLLQVEPVEYNYNTISGYDTKPSYVGVVAQDLQKIAPYMVGQFKKNGQEYLDINTSAMTYMMINAIKEQQKMIGELKNEIEALKKK